MFNPIFWLGLSILLVAVSLAAVLVAALPAFQELARAARSVEKLADTLRRELPPTLESIRLTGMEITDLTDDVNEGVKSATEIVKEVDQGLSGAKKQAQKVQVGTRSVVAGVKAAWKTLMRSPSNNNRRSRDRLPPSQRNTIEFGQEDYNRRIKSQNQEQLPEARSSLEMEAAAKFQRDRLPEVSAKDINNTSNYEDDYDDLELEDEEN